MATKKTKEQVDQQSAKDRLWESLDYSYGKKAEQVGESYDQAISQQDNALLKRGMQRSSYGAQTRANLLDKKAQAIGDVESEKIADYQNRATALEQQELENERWERQFAENQRQYNEGQAFTAEQNALNRAFQSSERESQQQYQSGENAIAREFQASQTAQQQQWQSRENELSRQQSQSQFDTQLAYQKERNAVEDAFKEKQYADSREDAAWQKEFNERQFQQSQQQWEAQQEQWREEFDYQKMTAEQQLNYNFVTYALQNGKDVSDEMLQKAGLSREDFSSMKARVQGLGGGVPAWKRDGFSSKEDYDEAKAAGFTDPAMWAQEKFIRSLEEADRQNQRNDKGLYGKVYF